MSKKYFFFMTSLFLISLLASAQNGKVKILQGRRMQFMTNKIVDLSYGNLREVPVLNATDEIEILILDNNDLDRLPTWIGTLKNLRILSVRNNNLTELNSKLSFCENLEQLYLSGNSNLSDLPSLSFCRKLELIDVVGTQINSVPAWVELMDSLYYFKYNEKNEKSGNQDISYNLQGRSALSLPAPKYDYQSEGIVEVEISIDRQGNVIQAVPGIKGSTTLDNYLLKVSKEAALEGVFESDPDAPVIQKGTITYNFKLK